MVWHDKVVWQEGMFLRAQHFQQQDRHVEHLLQARAAPLRPHPWGLTEIALDRDLLAADRFALASAAGVMEDGTPFDIPGTADAPVPTRVCNTLQEIIDGVLALAQVDTQVVIMSNGGFGGIHTQLIEALGAK